MEKLDNLNDEIEEGLLFELKEKPPANLHGEIMSSINRERRRIKFFNYRIYAPAVAALLLFAVALNRPELLEKINFIKNANITQKQTITGSEITDPNNNINHEGSGENVAANGTNAAGDNTNNQQNEGASPNDTAIDSSPEGNSSDLTNQNSSEQTNQNAATKQNSGKDTKIASGENTSKPDTIPIEDELPVEKNENELNQLNISNYLGMAFFKEPKINYEILLDSNKAAILNFITENNEQKLSTPNTYKLSLEQFENLDKLLNKYDIRKKLINEFDSATSRVVKINFVNYHILVDNSAPDVVKFIEDQGKCIKIDDLNYKITMEDLNELNKLLTSAGIKKESVNELSNEYAIFKALIVNYEVSFDSNQTAVANFLNDTGKCSSVNNSVYKMNRENFSKFKELLNNSSIEIKILNETNNQDILIKVNSI